MVPDNWKPTMINWSVGPWEYTLVMKSIGPDQRETGIDQLILAAHLLNFKTLWKSIGKIKRHQSKGKAQLRSSFPYLSVCTGQPLCSSNNQEDWFLHTSSCDDGLIYWSVQLVRAVLQCSTWAVDPSESPADGRTDGLKQLGTQDTKRQEARKQEKI